MRARRGRELGIALLAAAAALGGCAGERAAPAIAFTYNFGDTAFQGFLEAELERVRPPGATAIRVVGADAAFRDSTILGNLPAEVVRASRLAADPSVLVAVGPGGSREVLQVAPVYRDARLANLVPTATSRLLQGLGTYTLLLAPDDSVQGAFIGAFADSALGAQRAVVLHVPDEYGIGLAAGTAAAFRARGVALLDRITMRLTLDCTQPEARAVYDGMAAQVALRGVPDVAVLAARTVEAGCAARALRARFPKVAILAGDGTYLEEAFLQRAGPAAEGAYLVAFWHREADWPGAAEFARAFEASVGRRVRHGDAMFYDAVMAAGAAIRASRPDRAAVHAYLRGLGTARPAYAGVTGPVAFAPGRRHALLMTRVAGSGSVVVGR